MKLLNISILDALYQDALGVKIKYQSIPSFIVPVQVMALALEQSYKDTIARVAQAQQQNQPDPGKAFTLNIGSVNLAIKAAGRDPGITWRSVDIILDTLLQQVALGWITEFISEWTVPGTDICLLVSLSVLRRIALKRVKPA